MRKITAINDMTIYEEGTGTGIDYIVKASNKTLGRFPSLQQAVNFANGVTIDAFDKGMLPSPFNRYVKKIDMTGIDRADMDYLVHLHDLNCIAVKDVRLLLWGYMAMLAQTLFSTFINAPIIVEREPVEAVVRECESRLGVWELKNGAHIAFSLLKSLNLVGVCGAGYIFEKLPEVVMTTSEQGRFQEMQAYLRNRSQYPRLMGDGQ